MTEYKVAHTDYSLEEYDTAWTEKFKAIKSLVKNVFKNKILKIEHVGSTAIVGMKAKPVIDVLVIVKSIGDLIRERATMEALGYLYRENYISDDSIFFCKDVDGKRIENIHIFPKGHARIAQFIDKRNYLKEHPEEVRRYQQIKEEAARQFPNDYAAYKKYKEAYLNVELVKKIKEWKFQ